MHVLTQEVESGRIVCVTSAKHGPSFLTQGVGSPREHGAKEYRACPSGHANKQIPVLEEFLIALTCDGSLFSKVKVDTCKVSPELIVEEW